jgi:hypothetical protein
VIFLSASVIEAIDISKNFVALFGVHFVPIRKHLEGGVSNVRRPAMSWAEGCQFFRPKL